MIKGQKQEKKIQKMAKVNVNEIISTQIKYMIKYHDLKTNQWIIFQEMDSLNFDFQILYDHLQKEFKPKESINFRIYKVTTVVVKTDGEEKVNKHKQIIFMFIKPRSDMKEED